MTVLRYLILIVTSLGVVFAFQFVVAAEEITETEPVPTLQTPVRTDSTEWSSSTQTVQARILYRRSVDFAEPIELELQLQVGAADEHDGDSLFAVKAKTFLHLVNLDTGFDHQYEQTIEVIHGQEPSGIWRAAFSYDVDCGTREIEYAQSVRNPSFVARQPLVIEFHEALPVGKYQARVDLTLLPSGRELPCGLISPPSFTLTVEATESAARQHTFTFPKQLVLDYGPIVRGDTGALDTISIEVRPGYYLEYSISGDYGRLKAPGLPACPDIFLNSDLPESHASSNFYLTPTKRVVFADGKPVDLNLHVELRETPYAPGQRNACGLTNMLHRIWENDLSVSITEQAFDTLVSMESELYEYHTILVPSVLRLEPDDSLRFEGNGMELREVRVPRGWHIGTMISIEDSSAIWSQRPPDSPLLPMMRVGPNSAISVEIEVYAVTSNRESPDSNSTDRILLWSGLTELSNVGREFKVTGEYSQSIPQPWPVRTCYIPRELLLTDELELAAVPGDRIRISMMRRPGTALLAAISSRKRTIRGLPPDLRGLSISVASDEIRRDTIVCRMDLYEVPLDSEGYRHGKTVWSHVYKVPLKKGQARKLRKHIRKQE